MDGDALAASAVFKLDYVLIAGERGVLNGKNERNEIPIRR